ncbi:MAG: hypothetical protein FWD13_11690, partial [Treponema sp.]|nr:hypothetical protein [Treponema sp.]
KYNNMEGYIFGGNIAVKTFICDIDGNGTMDYFQHRISWQAANYHIDTRKDIILFINNIKINAGLLYAHDKTTIGEKYFFNLCSFEQVNNDVYITLSKASPVSLERYIFAVNALGDISLIDVYKTGSFFENDEWVEYE